jgi:hypothetical protein
MIEEFPYFDDGDDYSSVDRKGHRRYRSFWFRMANKGYEVKRERTNGLYDSYSLWPETGPGKEFWDILQKDIQFRDYFDCEDFTFE